MKISELKDKQKKVYISGKIVEKQKVFIMPGTNIKAVNIILEDDSGRCDISIYGNKVDEIQEGDTIMVCNAFCKGEYNNFKKITLGKYGYIMKR